MMSADGIQGFLTVFRLKESANPKAVKINKGTDAAADKAFILNY